MTNINEIWDIETIFAGGSQSADFATFMSALGTDLQTAATADPLPDLAGEASQNAWITTLKNVYGLNARLQQASSFIGCLTSQNVEDEDARQLEMELAPMRATLGTIWTRLSNQMVEQDDTQWDGLLQTDALSGVAFHLNEQRGNAKLKMDVGRETLVTELETNGYSAWGQLYNYIVGEKSVQFQEQTMSLGQLQNTFMDAPDRETRQTAFTLFEESWAELAQPCAMALNNLAGFRLTSYKHRGWESFLQEPLQMNRLTADTLLTMMDVIDQKVSQLKPFLDARAKLIGVDQLAWYDTWAPVGESSQSYSYGEAADLVIEKTGVINPDIAKFCQTAVDNRWIEAEFRAGKRAGAYCTSIPLNKEPRIFMTYNGSFSGLLTLAHELGHGYHGWVMRDLPTGAKRYTMSVAETASTLSELLVKNAVLDGITDDRERMAILGSSLNDAVSYLMNLPARFRFEKAFYEARRQRPLSVGALSEMMENAQKQAYKESLSQYHPLFWASKLHFYLTRVPFYNFPYTFGYLFSNGVYNAYVGGEGDGFVAGYKALLQDTGRMTTEQLAHKHLGVDLTQPEFWESAVDRVLADVGPFVALAEKA